MSDRHSRRIRSTIFNSIVFLCFENGRCCTLASALDLVVFQKVVIRYLCRAWTDREDIIDDRYARNRIQTSSWFDSGEQREFAGSQIGRWYARRHKEWKGALIERHRARKPRSCRICEAQWSCPVLKKFSCGIEITSSAVHIVPYVLGQLMIDYLLGGEKSTGDHTWWRHGNGILLSHSMAVYFSSGLFVLIPVPKDAGESDGLKLFLLDKDWMNVDRSTKWADYHDKELGFKSTHRPNRRYIYAHFVTSILRMAMDCGFSWTEDILADPACNWPPAEPLMRRSMARSLARELNCDKRLQRLYEKGLFDPQQGQIPSEEEMALAQMAYINVQDHGFRFDDNDVLYFSETEELKSEMTNSDEEDWELDGQSVLD
jgi:hypothetical protein